MSTSRGTGELAPLPSRDEFYLVELDPTRRSEIQKTRPCLVGGADDYLAKPFETRELEAT